MASRRYRGWHLAKTELEYRVTAFEWSLAQMNEAFARFVTELGTLTTASELKYGDHAVLHALRMPDRAKGGPTIARQLNRHDLQNVQYSLRKLESLGLIRKTREAGSAQAAYEITDKGRQRTDQYRDVRAELLIKRIEQIQKSPEQLEALTRLMSMLTGVYEEAARECATIAPDDLGES
ncbi:MAG TPA: winged helix DNA-binding protein [Caulobacteraceae bacterium]